MPLPADISELVDAYARRHLPGDLQWHIDQFSFLADAADLQKRVGEEFYTARYLYKILEGLHLDELWAASTQARLQVLQYASIYEACVHHVLFRKLKDRPEVKELGKYKALKEYAVPPGLFKSFQHDNKKIVSAYLSDQKAEVSKIKFENKIEATVNMGLIEAALGEDLKRIYEARNSIHIHAELKKQLEFDLEFGRLAYRRLLPFCQQINRFFDLQDK